MMNRPPGGDCPFCERAANEGPLPEWAETGEFLALNYRGQEFVWAWNTSHTRAEAAAEMGITPAAASARASRLRAKGLHIQRFRRETRVSASELSDILAGQELGDPENPWHAFVAAWRDCATIGEVSLRTHKSMNDVRAKASYLRSRGVVLPRRTIR